MMTENEDDSLENLIKSINLFDIQVMFECDTINRFEPSTKTIWIDTRQNKRSRYYSLLHEFGHSILRSDPNFEQNFKIKLEKATKGKESRVNLLREEVVAWEKAREFAESNGLPLDDKWFSFYCQKYIYQYAQWVVDPKSFTEE